MKNAGADHQVRSRTSNATQQTNVMASSTFAAAIDIWSAATNPRSSQNVTRWRVISVAVPVAVIVVCTHACSSLSRCAVP